MNRHERHWAARGYKVANFKKPLPEGVAVVRWINPGWTVAVAPNQVYFTGVSDSSTFRYKSAAYNAAIRKAEELRLQVLGETITDTLRATIDRGDIREMAIRVLFDDGFGALVEWLVKQRQQDAWRAGRVAQDTLKTNGVTIKPSSKMMDRWYARQPK